jgi:hypothetical protein
MADSDSSIRRCARGNTGVCQPVGGWPADISNNLPFIARSAPAVRVSDAARQAALASLDRYRQLGGRIEPNRIPRTRPAVLGFFLDDALRVWTLLTTDGSNRVVDVHDQAGTFVQRITLPVALRKDPQPIVRGNLLYGLALDELDVPGLVVLRIDNPQ